MSFCSHAHSIKNFPQNRKTVPIKNPLHGFTELLVVFFINMLFTWIKGGFLTVRRRFSWKNRYQKLKFIFMSCLFYRIIHVHVQCTSFTVCYPARLCESNVYCTNWMKPSPILHRSLATIILIQVHRSKLGVPNQMELIPCVKVQYCNSKFMITYSK